MIAYQESAEGIVPEQLGGFFGGWPNPPAPEAHLRILHGSDHLILALDQESDRVVGYITAISDGVSCAYIPHLEVLPSWKGRGIGTELMNQMLETLKDIYMIDLMCDADVQPFYDRFNMIRSTGMVIRNYARQSCESQSCESQSCE